MEAAQRIPAPQEAIRCLRLRLDRGPPPLGVIENERAAVIAMCRPPAER